MTIHARSLPFGRNSVARRYSDVRGPVVLWHADSGVSHGGFASLATGKAGAGRVHSGAPDERHIAREPFSASSVAAGLTTEQAVTARVDAGHD